MEALTTTSTTASLVVLPNQPSEFTTTTNKTITATTKLLFIGKFITMSYCYEVTL